MATTIMESRVETSLAEIIKSERLHSWSAGRKTTKSRQAGLAISILNAFWVTVDDFRLWTRLYGWFGATAMSTFGKKSVWKAEVEVLNSPYALRGRLGGGGGGGGKSGDNSGVIAGGSGPPEDPSGGPPSPGGGRGFGGHPRRSDDNDDFYDQAAREFKDIVGIESNRVSLSGAIITAVAATALGFPELSQSHWVARAFWISSLVTSLLAVYYAGSLVWKVGSLFSGSEIRSWLRGSDQDILDILGDEQSESGTLQMLAPSLSSVLTISAPGLLLSMSVLFLLLGFGIYLGFVWTRALDIDSGHGDSRSVFIVYLVVLAVFYVVYNLSNMVQDYGTGITVGDIIKKSVEKLGAELPKFVEARVERNRREQEERDTKNRHLVILDQILRTNNETSHHLAAIAARLQRAQVFVRGREYRQRSGFNSRRH